ncbi:MAG: hypothetical protein ACI8RD_012186 [Bacillariaceae sp.]|jgi:hypothetical protein
MVDAALSLLLLVVAVRIDEFTVWKIISLTLVCVFLLLLPYKTINIQWQLMASELIATSGDIRPHGHLKLGRFTQHFVSKHYIH